MVTCDYPNVKFSYILRLAIGVCFLQLYVFLQAACMSDYGRQEENPTGCCLINSQTSVFYMYYMT